MYSFASHGRASAAQGTNEPDAFRDWLAEWIHEHRVELDELLLAYWVCIWG